MKEIRSKYLDDCKNTSMDIRWTDAQDDRLSKIDSECNIESIDIAKGQSIPMSSARLRKFIKSIRRHIANIVMDIWTFHAMHKKKSCQFVRLRTNNKSRIASNIDYEEQSFVSTAGK